MTGFLKVIGLLALILHCNGLSRWQQDESYGNNEAVFRHKSGRRFEFPQGSVIIGAPSYPSHLPEAEAILPGHTLIRPALGMLKSAVKFPHRELEGGSGVYGNWDNLGIRYDGRNERVLYTGFRRSNSNDPIVVFLPSESIKHRSETKKDTQNKILSRIMQDMLKNTVKQRISILIFFFGILKIDIRLKMLESLEEEMEKMYYFLIRQITHSFRKNGDTIKLHICTRQCEKNNRII